MQPDDLDLGKYLEPTCTYPHTWVQVWSHCTVPANCLSPCAPVSTIPTTTGNPSRPSLSFPDINPKGAGSLFNETLKNYKALYYIPFS